MTMMAAVACNDIDSDRIPSYPVNINLTPQASWDTYGVTGFGNYRRFVRELREPSNFPWLERTTTGYGGILLIIGTDPYTHDPLTPLAYDLACPVERRQDVRVNMVSLPEWPMPVAQCPDCHSCYNVIEGGGRPLSGLAESEHYGLRMYQCIPPASDIGGYLVTNRY